LLVDEKSPQLKSFSDRLTDPLRLLTEFNNAQAKESMMSEDKMKPIDEAIELSNEELEDLSGGLNLKFSSVFFRETDVKASGGGSSPSSFSSETIESAGLQVLLTDATTEDLKILGKLLGGSAAIEGSD
jgi:hypothetical protein